MLTGGGMGNDQDEDFTSFVHERSPALMRVAFLLTGDRGLAEDLLQSSLEKASRRWPALQDPAAAYSYVRRALINTHISWRRRRSVHEILHDSMPHTAAASAPSAYPQADEAMAALAQLPPRMRTVIVLRFYEGLSEADTAAAMNCSIGSVKSQASRGLARLRVQLDHPTTASTTERARR